MDLSQFEARLAAAIAVELRIQQYRLQFEEMRVFDLGCFPWHASLELSFLTRREVEAVTADPTNPADWRWYNFNAGYSEPWPAGRELTAWLDELRKRDVPHDDAELWRACGRAMVTDPVQAELKRYRRTEDFVCTVFDPDARDGFNFVTGQVVPWLVPPSAPR